MRQQAKTVARKGTMLVCLLVLTSIATVACVARINCTESATELPQTVIARRLLTEGRLMEAEALYQQEFERNADNTEAIIGLATCAERNGNHDVSINWWQKATDVSPENSNAWRGLAEALARKGRTIEAVTAATRALRLEGNDPQAQDLVNRLTTQHVEELNARQASPASTRSLPRPPLPRRPK